MKPTIITEPNIFIRAYMKFLGYKGLTVRGKIIYFIDGYENSKKLMAHEMKHIEQQNREGWIKFFLKYNWYWVTRGYKNNPYEIEAREAEIS